MRLKCEHGFFTFFDFKVGQISDYMSMTGLKIVPYGEHYTFEALQSAPGYSIKGSPLLGLAATKTFAGRPAEVFEANGFVYNISSGLMVPISSVTTKTQIKLAGNRFTSPGLIQPGSLNDDGDRVKSFAGFFSRDRNSWLYSEVDYV